MVGCYGRGHVALPGLLGRGSLLQEDYWIGETVHFGEMPDVHGPCPAVLVADGEQVLDQLVNLGVRVAPDTVED